MKVYTAFLVFALISILSFSCKDPDAALRKELDAAIFKRDMMEKQLEGVQTSKSGDLVHIVFMNLKDDLSGSEYAKFVEELNQLQGIPTVRDFTLGDLKPFDDPRQLGDYEIVMSMAFDDETAYKTYQEHPKHLALKETLGSFLEGPHAIYDYVKK